MPWQKKAAAPSYAYAAEEVRALIQGTPDSWLGDWLWLLGGVAVPVVPLCAAGPQTCVDLDEADFLGLALSGSRAGAALNFALLTPKLQCIISQKLFGAYCENTTPAEGTPSWHSYQTAACGSGPDVWDCVIWSGGPGLPSWATQLREEVYSGGGANIALSVSWPTPMPEGVAVEFGQTGRNISGYGGVDAVVGGSRTLDIAPYQSAGRTLYPFLVRRGGTPPPIVPYCVTLDYFGASPGGAVDYVPPDVFRPASAITPPSQTYTDIADLGRELDNLERKLELLLDTAATNTVATMWPLVTSGVPFAIANDVDFAIPEGGGFIVHVANIGNQTDELFGEPRRLHRLGRVTLGSADAWMPPIEITVEPLLLVGLPLEITRARVHVSAPAVATVQVLRRSAPVG